VYQEHAGFSERFGTEDPLDLYDGEVAFTDHHLGRLLERVRAPGLADSTIVVVTSDHGEEFGDHGGTGHRNHLHAEVQRVPLLVRAPGVGRRRVADAVSLVDVAPTVLELAGAPALEGAAGRSLVPLLRGAPLEPRPVLGELGANVVMHESVVVGDWKLIVDSVEERELLYDLAGDPAEVDDLRASEPARADELRAALRRLVAEAAARSKAYPAGDTPLALTPRDLESLRQLGYVEDE
jgi:arylsulfatase A-like enzyme